MNNPSDWAMRPLTDTSGLEGLVRTSVPRAEMDQIEPRTTALKRAVLLLRVSSDRQMNTAIDIDAEGNSIATQREWGRDKSRALHAEIVQEFVEPGHSAQTIEKRPIFREMLRYAKDPDNSIDYVIIYSRSRAFRNIYDAVIVEKELNELGIELISATEQFGEDEDMAIAFKVFTDVMNHVQVRTNGKDIKKKMLHKAQQGGTVGRAKLGYLNVRKDFGGRLVNTIDVDPERAPLIKWAFEAYATGDYSLVRLQASLGEQGLTTRATVHWTSQIMSVSQLALILRDPYYTGVILYKGELFPGRHEPLISKELFLKVQDVMSERARRGQRDRKHHHFLKGLLYCQRCAKNGRKSRLVFTQVETKNATYEYYICRGKQDGFCDMAYLPVAELEDAVARCIANEELPEDYIDLLRNEVEQATKNNQESDREMRDNLAKQLKKLEIREDGLLDLAADRELNSAKLKERLRTIALERGSIQEQLDRTDKDLERGASTILTYLKLLAEPGNLYDRSPNNVKRQLLEAFFAELRADIGDRIDVEGAEKEPVAELRDGARALRTRRASVDSPSRKNKNPRLSTGELEFQTNVNSLADFFKTHFSSKATLVAGVGFEPTTLWL